MLTVNASPTTRNVERLIKKDRLNNFLSNSLLIIVTSPLLVKI